MSKPQIVKATERRILQCQYQINLEEDATICSNNDSITHRIQTIPHMVRAEKYVCVCVCVCVFYVYMRNFAQISGNLFFHRCMLKPTTQLGLIMNLIKMTCMQ